MVKPIGRILNAEAIEQIAEELKKLASIQETLGYPEDAKITLMIIANLLKSIGK